jgi:hypothetical protein
MELFLASLKNTSAKIPSELEFFTLILYFTNWDNKFGLLFLRGIIFIYIATIIGACIEKSATDFSRKAGDFSWQTSAFHIKIALRSYEIGEKLQKKLCQVAYYYSYHCTVPSLEKLILQEDYFNSFYERTYISCNENWFFHSYYSIIVVTVSLTRNQHIIAPDPWSTHTLFI